MKQAAGIALLALSSLSTVKGQGTVQDFTLNDTENEQVSYSDLKGDKLTVIDFWATWCQPCVSSIPKLVEIRSEFGDQGVAFIGVSVDSPRNMSKVKPFSRSLGIDYPVLLDSNSEVMGDLNVTAVPTLMIVGSDDKILYMHEGYHAGDERIIREEIEKYLSSTQQ